MAKFLRSGKSRPCPVCGREKDADCAWTIDRAFILCHSNFDHENSTRFGVLGSREDYVFIGESSDHRAGQYVKSRYEKPEITSSSTEEDIYTDINNNYLIKVKRINPQGGKKTFRQGRYDPSAHTADRDGFVFETGAISEYPEVRKQVAIFRYKEVQKAIALGQRVYWVEGESTVKAMEQRGLTATTSIGGSQAFGTYGSYAGQLRGANLVICPDMDKKGVKYAEQVEALFGNEVANIKWLYAYPYSKVWAELPDDHGLDCANWINDGADKDLIEDSICVKRFLEEEYNLTKVKDHYNRIASKLRAIDNFLPHPGEQHLALRILSNQEKIPIQEVRQLMSYQKVTKSLQSVTWKELHSSVDENIEWLVQNLIPRSNTFLLAGQPGSGKSLLFYDLAYCVVNGYPWLGYSVKKGRVLYVQLEEGKGIVPVSRGVLRGFDPDELNIEFLFESTIADIPAIISLCASGGFDLCLIDSLSAINRENVENENNPAYAFPLQQLTDATAGIKTSFGIIHHAVKGTAETRKTKVDGLDSIDEVRGSGAISASVHSNFIFKRSVKGGLMRTLSCVKSRLPVIFDKHLLQLNTTNNSFRFVGKVSPGGAEVEDEPYEFDEEDLVAESDGSRSPGKAIQLKSIASRDKIIEFLERNPSVRFELEEISEVTNISTAAIKPVLGRLVDDGIVIKEKNLSKKYVWKIVDVGDYSQPADYLLSSANLSPGDYLEPTDEEDDF